MYARKLRTKGELREQTTGLGKPVLTDLPKNIGVQRSNSVVLPKVYLSRGDEYKVGIAKYDSLNAANCTVLAPLTLPLHRYNASNGEVNLYRMQPSNLIVRDDVSNNARNSEQSAFVLA